MSSIVYLASPYSDPDEKVRQERFEVVCKAAAALVQAHDVYLFVPIAHSHPLAVHGGLSGAWEFWEGYDKAFLDKADAIWVLMLEGWQDSTGVTAERAYANEIGLETRYVTYPELELL